MYVESRAVGAGKRYDIYKEEEEEGGEGKKKRISAVFYWSATAERRSSSTRSAERALQTLESFGSAAAQHTHTHTAHVYTGDFSIDSATPSLTHTQSRAEYNRPKPFRHLLPGCCMWHVICASILFPSFFFFLFIHVLHTFFFSPYPIYNRGIYQNLFVC